MKRNFVLATFLLCLMAAPGLAWLAQPCPAGSSSPCPSANLAKAIRQAGPPQESEQGCNSADVSFAPVTPGLTYTCGEPAPVLLANAGNCTIITGGLEVCDGNLENCHLCTAFAPSGTGWVFNCDTLGIAGTQVYTATYLLGPLQGTIATAVPVSCASPFVTPQAPPPPHTPVPCDSNSVSFTLNGPFTCGGGFTATLTTSSNCNLSSGGALVCNSIGRDCIACPASGSGSTVSYDCTSLLTSGDQIVTATYLLGPFTGTIAQDADFGCPSARSIGT